MAHLSLDIKNAQLATFIPDWNKVNEELASGAIGADEYQAWLEQFSQSFYSKGNYYVQPHF